MNNQVLGIRRACPTDARRAIFDFAVLSILIYLFLAFLHPDRIYFYIYLSSPQLIIVLLSKYERGYVYPFAIAFALTSIVIGIYQGIYPVSLKEWGIFFKLGYSLRFSQLADLPLFLNFAGIIYFSVRGMILNKGIE